jgi:uncharacterized protein (TIGR02466 family)
MRPSKIIQQDLTYSPAQGEMLDLFPTRMFRGYCPINREVVNKDIRNIINGIKEKDPDNLAENYTTYFYEEGREEMEKLPWFTDFANQMKDTYIAFIKQNYDMRVDHLSRHDIHFFCWANLYNEENEHQTHIHLRSLISGTYYPLITGKEAIQFYTPNVAGDFGTRAMNKGIDLGIRNTRFHGTEGTQSSVEFFPEDGEFLLWPSSMLHCVGRAKPEDRDGYERISISFNLDHNDPLEDTNNGTDMRYDFIK